MDEMIKIWLMQMYGKELDGVIGTIENESIWEKAIPEGEVNYHTDNIKRLKEYADMLREKIEELSK